MSGKFILDTNIVIAVFSNDMAVKELLSTAIEVFIPNIVIGELYFGAFNSGRKSENVALIDEFVIKSSILNCDSNTSKEYGSLKSELRIKGKPIPENDIWIAALARQYAKTLVTRDDHFKVVDGLDLELV